MSIKRNRRGNPADGDPTNPGAGLLPLRAFLILFFAAVVAAGAGILSWYVEPSLAAAFVSAACGFGGAFGFADRAVDRNR
jgi:hypothetical protein